MLSQEMLAHIEFLRENQKTFADIGRSLDIPANKVHYTFKSYILPFSEVFNSIITELKLYDMAVYRRECQNLLYRVKSSLTKSQKFLNVNLLAPVVVYAVFRSKGEIIKPPDLCRVAHISLGDFREGLVVVYPVYTAYIKRDREKFVAQLIDKVIAKFNLDSLFEDTAKKLLKIFFPLFKNTKDNIIAGLTATLSFVVLDYKLMPLLDIFEALGTDVTRAHYHVNRKIFLPNNLGDFKGFEKAKKPLKQFLLTRMNGSSGKR